MAQRDNKPQPQARNHTGGRQSPASTYEIGEDDKSAGSDGSGDHDIIVIGGSAGAIEVLLGIVASLPRSLRAAVFVVIHLVPHQRSVLPDILNYQEVLPAAHVRDGEAVEHGRIYVALPDHHLLLEGGAIRVTSGPREHYTRPAVDPLFRTAAREYGPRVVAVLLSGALSDGTAGMAEVKQHGGVTIVQDPQEATQPSMPQSAIDAAQVDHIASVEEIAALLVRLTQRKEDSGTGIGIGGTSRDADRRKGTKGEVVCGGHATP